MAQTPRSHTAITLLLLLALGVSIAACEQGETPLGFTPSTPGSILIESGADGASSWILVAPDGSEIQGQGDSLIAVPQEGEYWLLWEPVEAWHSPSNNPMRLSYKRGDVRVIAADYEEISGAMGTLRMDPAPDGTEAAWNLYGPNGFFAAGRGAGTLARRATGSYTVIWERVDGFVTPPQSSGELAGNAVLTLVADYQPVSSGAGEIDVVVAPAGLFAPWELRLSNGSVWSGHGSLTLPAMPVGEYTITWGEAQGYEAPGGSSAVLANGQRISFRGDYVDLPDPVGSFTIDVAPDGVGASWVLSSTAGARYEGQGDRRLEGIPVGLYTLSAQPLDGYLTPTPVEVYLAAGWDITWSFTWVREADPVGTLVIDPQPDAIQAPWQLLSGSALVQAGQGDATLVNLPVGDYEVFWGDVDGYATPPRSAVSIGDGTTVTALATYEALPDPLGTVVINPDPDEIQPPWQLLLPGGSVLQGSGDATLVDMALGEYTLTWGDVGGWETPTPNPVRLTLGAGGVALFSLR